MVPTELENTIPDIHKWTSIFVINPPPSLKEQFSTDLQNRIVCHVSWQSSSLPPSLRARLQPFTRQSASHIRSFVDKSGRYSEEPRHSVQLPTSCRCFVVATWLKDGENSSSLSLPSSLSLQDT